MKKNILLLEDDAIQAKALKQMINNYSANIEVYYAMNLEQADNLLKKEIIFNAFFLDISLDNKNADHAGLSLARQIRSVTRYQHTPFVFITAFPEHIYSAVNQLHCFAYLVKPYSEKELHKQLACLFEPKHTILLKTSENIHIRLSLDALQYVNSNGRYLTYVTASSKCHSRQYTLKKLINILPDGFIRCHRSYIINQAFVKNFDFVNHFVHMIVNDELIPISRNFSLPLENV